MNSPRPGSRFWPWGEPRPAPAEPDPADFGTAFGLDMSFGPVDEASERLAPPQGPSSVATDQFKR